MAALVIWSRRFSLRFAAASSGSLCIVANSRATSSASQVGQSLSVSVLPGPTMTSTCSSGVAFSLRWWRAVLATCAATISALVLRVLFIRVSKNLWYSLAISSCSFRRSFDAARRSAWLSVANANGAKPVGCFGAVSRTGELGSQAFSSGYCRQATLASISLVYGGYRDRSVSVNVSVRVREHMRAHGCVLQQRTLACFSRALRIRSRWPLWLIATFADKTFLAETGLNPGELGIAATAAAAAASASASAAASASSSSNSSACSCCWVFLKNSREKFSGWKVAWS
mmetsp:Transcript_45223/g.124270  ORF Transcript_45223/g.124270 Transcript_45223/m.124270 type:complete len:285 (+) Transcript_45223:1027-1881(+)